MSARSATRVRLLRPPADQLQHDHWHTIDAGPCELTLQWRPTIEVWRDVEGGRWTAETAAQMSWKYVGPAPDPFAEDDP